MAKHAIPPQRSSIGLKEGTGQHALLNEHSKEDSGNDAPEDGARNVILDHLGNGDNQPEDQTERT